MPPAARELPPLARRFLGARHGRTLRAVVGRFHAWLGRRRLDLAELTPDHLRRFLASPRRTHLALRTSHVYGAALRRYLQWLHDRGRLGFDPEHLRRHPKRLPGCAREFLASLAPTHKPGTCLAYAVSLRRFHSWLDRHGRAPQHLDRRDMTKWLVEVHTRGFAPSTRVHLLFHTRAYLHWLAERHVMFTHPDELIRRSDFPKLPAYLPRPLSPELDRELQRRLSSSADVYQQGLLLMRHTGLRVGELRALEHDCLRRDRHYLLLKVPLGKLNNERLVPLDDQTAALVHRLQQRSPRRRRYLLADPSGQQLVYQHFRDVLHAVCRDLEDAKPITSHRLRHTYATEMLSAGMSLVGVMRLLGHRDFRMTLRYAAITPETVGKEYYQALTQLATKYHLPTPITPAPPPSAEQLLDHLAHWLRHPGAGHRPPRSLLKRIDRLQREIRLLNQPPTT